MGKGRVPGSVETSKWYKVRVEARGKRFKCYLDDKLVFDFEDDKHPRGAVMLGAFKTSYRVRNIKVTDPDGKALFEGLPKLEPSEADVLRPRADALRRKLDELTR